MQIKSLTLKNFRGFKDTEITFSEGLTVLVGVNGAGKSSVLDALAMMMSQVSSQWKDSIERLSIAASDVHADRDLASVGIWVEHLSSQYTWEVNRSGGKDGRSTDPAHDLNSELCDSTEINQNQRIHCWSDSDLLPCHSPGARRAYSPSVRRWIASAT